MKRYETYNDRFLLELNLSIRKSTPPLKSHTHIYLYSLSTSRNLQQSPFYLLLPISRYFLVQVFTIGGAARVKAPLMIT